MPSGNDGVSRSIHLKQTEKRKAGLEGVGGFHLQDSRLIAPTIAALKGIGPRYVVPMHCTGWLAIHEFARAMPEAFVANSVGTTLVF